MEAASVVVVAEADETIRGLYVDLLGGHYEVVTAADAPAAASLLMQRHVDLRVTGLMMPGLGDAQHGGLELLTLVKGERRLARLPVLVATVAPALLARESYRCVKAVLPKPFTIVELQQAVTACMPTNAN